MLACAPIGPSTARIVFNVPLSCASLRRSVSRCRSAPRMSGGEIGGDVAQAVAALHPAGMALADEHAVEFEPRARWRARGIFHERDAADGVACPYLLAEAAQRLEQPGVLGKHVVAPVV